MSLAPSYPGAYNPHDPQYNLHDPHLSFFWRIMYIIWDLKKCRDDMVADMMADMEVDMEADMVGGNYLT